jgi:hypothetical protein
LYFRPLHIRRASFVVVHCYCLDRLRTTVIFHSDPNPNPFKEGKKPFTKPSQEPFSKTLQKPFFKPIQPEAICQAY